VRLNISDDELAKRRRFLVEEMTVVTDDPHTGAGNVVWVDPYGGPQLETGTKRLPVTRVQVTRGIGDLAVLVGKDTPVFTRGGKKVGHVDHVAVDRVTMEPMLLIVRLPGIRRRRVMVSSDDIQDFERTGVVLKLHRDELKALPPYAPHAADAQIVADSQRALKTSGITVAGLEVASSDGHVVVRGHVASDEDRRRVDSLVRGMVGVVCVDNEITTNRLLATRVQARLDDDPVAGLYPVEVLVDGAVVHLTGTVPNGAVHQIVREIVDHTPGVARVDDGLEIRPEDYSHPPVVSAK
jgi:hypothetical protein